jgi:hypothetical protein
MVRVFQKCTSRRKKVFGLLPCKRGFTTCCIKINNNALRGLLLEAEVEGVPDESTFIREAREWWSRLFNIGALETGNRRFAKEVLTDGRTVCIVMRRRAPRLIDVSLHVDGDGWVRMSIYVKPDLSLTPGDALARATVIKGIDPGKTKMFTASSCTRDATTGEVSPFRREVEVCTAREFYHDAKYKESLLKIQKWTRERAHDIGVILAAMPPRKYKTLRGCMMRVQYVLRHWVVLRGFYGDSRFKNLKLKRHIYAKKKLDAVCRSLTKDGTPGCKDVLIGYGDWGRGKNSGVGAGIKGVPCGPYAKLRKRLEKYAMVFDVDEAYTSKVCSCCHGHTLCNMTNKFREQERRKVHGILHCINSRCQRKTWDRDVNASKNILEIFLATLHGRRRPRVFSLAGSKA